MKLLLTLFLSIALKVCSSASSNSGSSSISIQSISDEFSSMSMGSSSSSGTQKPLDAKDEVWDYFAYSVELKAEEKKPPAEEQAPKASVGVVETSFDIKKEKEKRKERGNKIKKNLLDRKNDKTFDLDKNELAKNLSSLSDALKASDMILFTNVDKEIINSKETENYYALLLDCKEDFYIYKTFKDFSKKYENTEHINTVKVIGFITRKNRGIILLKGSDPSSFNPENFVDVNVTSGKWTKLTGKYNGTRLEMENAIVAELINPGQARENK